MVALYWIVVKYAQHVYLKKSLVNFVACALYTCFFGCLVKIIQMWIPSNKAGFMLVMPNVDEALVRVPPALWTAAFWMALGFWINALRITDLRRKKRAWSPWEVGAIVVAVVNAILPIAGFSIMFPLGPQFTLTRVYFCLPSYFAVVAQLCIFLYVLKRNYHPNMDELTPELRVKMAYFKNHLGCATVVLALSDILSGLFLIEEVWSYSFVLEMVVFWLVTLLDIALLFIMLSLLSLEMHLVGLTKWAIKHSNKSNWSTKSSSASKSTPSDPPTSSELPSSTRMELDEE